eukprot:s43_g37.t1
MADKVSAVLPCRASAPDLRRNRLEKLLEKQQEMRGNRPLLLQKLVGPPPSAARLRAGHPTSWRRPYGFPRVPPNQARAATESLRLPTAESSVPAIAPQHPTESSSRLPTGTSRKVEEQVGSFIKQLVGDEGDGMLHWRLVNEMDAIDGLIQDNIEKHRAAEQKARQRTVLEEQVREARKKDQDLNLSRMHWGTQIQVWQEEERLKKLRQQETLRKFNEEQARHAEASRRRRDAEAEEVAQIERDMAQQALDAKRRSEAAEEQRKKKQQEMARQMADAAREAAEQKVLRKQAEAQKELEHVYEWDIAMMKAQIAVMEEQERQRAASFQRMKDKQGKAQAQYEAKAGSEQARLRKEEHI